MKVAGTFLILIVSFYQVVAQAPIGFNYQGVARNSDGSPQVHQAISIRVNILTGGVSGTVDYSETHIVTTNSFGLFTVTIGQGEKAGKLQNVDWSAGDKWLQIEMDLNGGADYQMVGAQQIFSVPYAMYASQAGSGLHAGEGLGISDGVISNTQPDVPVKLLGGGNVTVTGNYPEYIITGSEGNQNLTSVLNNGADAGGKNLTGLGNPVNKNDAATKIYVDNKNIDDADADPLNEIQDLQLSGNLLSLTLNGTPTVIDLTPYLDNTDSQTLNVSSTTTQRTIDISNGNSVSFDVADNDDDAGNELQTINKILNTVTLSDGGGSISVDDGDSDNTNELQVLTKVGNQVDLSNGGGTCIDEVDDADTDPANEIQTLSNVSNNLTLSSGGSVDLSGYLDNTDSQDLSSSSAGTNRTINISGGTGTTISVADNDNSVLNELISSFTNEAGNTLRLSDSGGDKIVSFGTLNADLDASGNKIINVGDPVNLNDVVNLGFLEAKVATDYAISAGINYTSSGAGDVALDLSGATLDKGNLITGSTITILEDGVYSISVQGYSLLGVGSDIEITIDGSGSPVLRGGSNYLGTYLFELVIGNQIEIIVKFGGTTETINLQVSVYKI